MIPITDRVVDPAVLDKAVAHFRSRGHHPAHLRRAARPGADPRQDQGQAARDRPLGPAPAQPLPHHLEERAAGRRAASSAASTSWSCPPALTGVKARIVLLIGKWFPTGAHKVGAAYGCLVPRLVSGQFDPTYHKAVWPSTGNYCRGGAFDSYLMGCTAVAILPEGMSRERFEWLQEIGAEVIATPGSESNVKEIYDKCWEIRADPARLRHLQPVRRVRQLRAGTITTPAPPSRRSSAASPAPAPPWPPTSPPPARPAPSPPATTCAAVSRALKVVATEALQCPTLLQNGFGAHRIEGIGDKHVPWVHNVRNTDAVAAIDDEDCMRLFRLFNEPAGRERLAALGMDRGAGRTTAAAGHLRHRQRPGRDQDRQAFRTGRRRHHLHPGHRFLRPLRLAPGGADRRARAPTRPCRRPATWSAACGARATTTSRSSPTATARPSTT